MSLLFTKIKRFPWVFWFTIEITSYSDGCYRTRGSNYLELYIGKVKISICMPWVQKVLLRYANADEDCDGLEHCISVNHSFNKWNHFQIGSEYNIQYVI